MQIKGENWFTCTLCFLVKDDQVLLGEKQEKIIAGCLTGPGGRLEDGESITACAVREVFEETGGIIISESDLEYSGLVFCRNKLADGSFLTVKIFVYLAQKWIGQPRDTDEMKDFRFYDLSALPKRRFPPGDRFWLYRLLAGEKIIAMVEYDKKQKILLSDPTVIAVDRLPADN